MAREHANLWLDIWSDADFQELTAGQQRLYMLLFSQKTINNAGVLPMMPSKWARASKHTTLDEIEADLAVLEAKRFVLVDLDTEEVLVRSYVRRDGLAKHKYLLRNALTVAKRTESPVLRRALAAELRRLGNPEADVVADELAADPNPTPSEPNAIPMPSESHSNAQVVVEGVVAVGTQGERNVGGSVGRPRLKTKRGAPKGTRLPADFAVTPEMVAWAREHAPDVDGRLSTDAFVDFWLSKPGKDGVKLDWVATWRNWLRRDQRDAERAPARASPANGYRSQTDANIAAFLGANPPNLRALPGGAS